MSWRKKTKKFLCRLILVHTRERAVFNEAECELILRREATDWLFMALGFFTYIYMAALGVLFFGRLGDDFPGFFIVLDALQEPYLGALGIYVILKEVRKRRRVYPSQYRGELFVVAWVTFLMAATGLVLFSPGYVFDGIYKIILTSGLVVIVIFMGSIINKP